MPWRENTVVPTHPEPEEVMTVLALQGLMCLARLGIATAFLSPGLAPRLGARTPLSGFPRTLEGLTFSGSPARNVPLIMSGGNAAHEGEALDADLGALDHRPSRLVKTSPFRTLVADGKVLYLSPGLIVSFHTKQSVAFSLLRICVVCSPISMHVRRHKHFVLYCRKRQ